MTPDHDELLAQGTVDFRNEERRARNGRDLGTAQRCGPCPVCGDEKDPVEGKCWECDARRSWPVCVIDESAGMAELAELVDDELIRTVENPPL